MNKTGNLRQTIIEEYWNKKCSGELMELQLPFVIPSIPDSEKSRSNVSQNDKCPLYEIELPSSLEKLLNHTSKQSDLAIFILFISGLNLLLTRYSASTNWVLGSLSPQSNGGDDHPIFFRFPYSEDIPIKEHISRTQKEILSSINYATNSLDKTLSTLAPEHPEKISSLFNIAFIFLPYQKITNSFSRFRQQMILSRKTGDHPHLSFSINCPDSIISSEGAGSFCQNLFSTLERMLEDPNRLYAHLDILSPLEKEHLFYRFNNTRCQYSKDQTVDRLFEEQVRKTPDSIAIIGKNSSSDLLHLTYQQLSEKVDRIAGILKDKGIRQGTDDIVAVMIDRSDDLLISILGVLRAGAAYLPIDPTFPVDRINYILKSSCTNIILTTVPSGAIIGNEFHNRRLYLETGFNENNVIHVKSLSAPSDLAYVIYTSGSTGNPKGVAIYHRNVVNFIKGITDRIDFAPGKSILAVTTISFDIFVLESLVPLATGGKVLLADEAQQTEYELLADTIRKHCIQMLQMTPSRLNLMLLGTQSLDFLKYVEELMVGGEVFPKPLFKQVKKEYRGKLYNLYGPTETTVWSTLKDLSESDRITIGTPIANTQIYILDGKDRLLPINVAGELCIAGDGVSRGYLNNPQLTDDTFIVQKFKELCPDVSLRLYRTGDVARWRHDGEIEILGRRDHQVKIRGFRIELGDIENHLLRHPSVKEVVVTTRSSGTGSLDTGSYLCAYIVPSKQLDISILSKYLEEKLPEYMIPSYFIELEKLPMTTSGKIDRKQLPEPDDRNSLEPYVAPKGEIEKKLVDIWSDVLGLEKNQIGMGHNFFRQGGHSLRAAVLMSRLHQELNVKVSLSQFIKSPTLKELANLIKPTQKDAFKSIEPVEKKEYYPLSASQRRIYVAQQMAPGGISYNMPVMFILEGNINKEKIEKIFYKLIARHDIYRTSFILLENKPVQKISEIVPFKLEYYESDLKGSRQLADDFTRPFDLSQAPLLRTGLIKIDGHKHILMFDVHHIISDAVSYELLVREFVGLYDRVELPHLRIQYKDFSQWQHNLFDSGEMKKQRDYWLKVFKQIPELKIPLDLPRPVKRNIEKGGHVNGFLDDELINKLKSLMEECGVTLYTILMASYYVLLSRSTAQNDIVIGCVVTGRSHADLEHVIGMFGNVLPIRCYPRRDKTFRQLLKEVQEKSSEAFDNQDYPLDKLVVDLGLQGETGRNPLFDVAFNLNNVERAKVNNNNLIVKPFGSKTEFAKFDLTLYATEVEDRIDFSIRYSTQLFYHSTVEQLLHYYIEIIKQAVQNIDKKLSQIKISQNKKSVRTKKSTARKEQDDSFIL